MKRFMKPAVTFGLAAMLLGAPSVPGMTNFDLTNPVMSTASAAAQVPGARIMEIVPLNQGEVTVTEYGDIKVHAFRTGDALSDECYALESDQGLVLIEATIMKDDMTAWKGYLDKLGKLIAGAFMAYHPNGYERLGDVPILATEKALTNWQPGGAIYGISSGLSNAFGDAADGMMPAASDVTRVLRDGETVTLAGIDVKVLASHDDAYTLEIPALNAVYRHMMGSHVHSILASRDYIRNEIRELQTYQKSGYTLILTSHYVPEGREAVTTKLDYLKTALTFAETCPDGASFKAAMQKAFPNYEDVKYLDMSVQSLYPTTAE